MTMPLTTPGMAETFLFQKLAGDSQIQAILGNPAKVYAGLAPEGTAPPYVTFASMGGQDNTPLGNVRAMSFPLYQVKAITNTGSLAALDALMARVDALLQGATMTFSPGGVLACTRDSTIVLADPDMGVSYRQLIFTYRLVATESFVG